MTNGPPDPSANPNAAPTDALAVNEARHMNWVLVDMVDRHMLEHQAIEADPAWLAMAQEAHDRLWALYQAVGGEELS